MVINSYERKNYTNNTVKIGAIDLLTLDAFCRYLLQSISNVKLEHLINLRKLMRILDPSLYENDPEKLKRYKFIIKGLEARIDNNINDKMLILTYINGGMDSKVDFIDYNHIDLSRDEVSYIHKLVSESLKYQFVYREADNLIELGMKIKSSTFDNRKDIIDQLDKEITNLKNMFRKVEVDDNSVDMTFSLREGTFESAVTNTWNLITNPSRRLVCGMQGLNEMVGGGFESGRIYMLLGTSGVGKSITLLNLIYQMKRYNKYFKPKDPTKTPCIVLLTMENTVVETITRLYDMVIDGSTGMKNCPSAVDCINILRQQGQLIVNDTSPIDIVIKYKPNKSIDTSYLYSLYDDLKDDGYEMICLVQDHVKRIRSIYTGNDIRLELGDVVNELKVFAADKDIPVITNSHLNRDAARVIEEEERKGNRDVGKLLGKSNIGESMLMIDNLDCGIIITLDYDKDSNKYLTFNLIKMRDKTNRTYIAQPFSPESSIRLQEDFGGIPLFKESIHMAPELVNRKHGNVKLSGSSGLTSMDGSIGEYTLSDNSELDKVNDKFNNDLADFLEEFNDTNTNADIRFNSAPEEVLIFNDYSALVVGNNNNNNNIINERINDIDAEEALVFF